MYSRGGLSVIAAKCIITREIRGEWEDVVTAWEDVLYPGVERLSFARIFNVEKHRK